MPKHRGKRFNRQSTVNVDLEEEEERSSSDEKPENRDIERKVETLRTTYSADLSNLQFVLATLSIATAVYLLLQNSKTLQNWRPEVKQAYPDQFGRLRDHRYIEARPDGLSWSKTSSARRKLAPPTQTDGGWRNASKQIWNVFYTQRCDVIRKSSKKMTLKKFETQYQNKKPLLIRFPEGAEAWVPTDLWSYAKLTKSYAEWEKKTRRDRQDSHTGQRLSSFEQYVRESVTDISNKDTTFQFPTEFFEESPLQHIVHPPDYLNSSFYDSRNSVVFGSSMAGGHFHRHTDSWNGLVFGKRRWFLFPPTQTPPGGNSVQVADWFRRIRPRLEANEMPMECIQEPGDILYIPDSWYHASISIGDSVAIGFRKTRSERRMSNLTKQLDLIRADATLDEREKTLAKLRIWEEIHENYPFNTEALNRLGEIYASRGEMSEAVQKMDKIVEIDPFFLDAYLNLGKIYFSVEDFFSAEEYFKLSAEINPKNFHVCRIFGEFLVSQKRFVDAINMFETGALYNPDKAAFFRQLIQQAEDLKS